ncbi:hypothetical protein ACQJBY_008291 [Aegilops geniculata]
MRSYVTTHNNAAKIKKWSRVVYKLTVSDDQTEFTCERGQLEHTGMLCSHILRVMEIPEKHIVKRWAKDVRDILPGHLVQYQKDNSINLLFTCRHSKLYFRAMNVVRMGYASAESFDFMFAGLGDLLLHGAPIAEKRDGLGFKDCMAGLAPSRLPANGEVAFGGGEGANQGISAAQSASANDLQGLASPDKQRCVGRLTNSREKALYEV